LGNDGVAHLYDLKVGFGISGEGIAVQSDTIATRIRMIGTATWTLVAKDPGRTQISHGFAKAVDGFNLLDEQVFAADLSNEAIQKRLAEALADQITLQLATFFRRRAAANS